MNWEWLDKVWPVWLPSRTLLLRYFSSALSIIALIAVYVGAANGKSWGAVVLILAIAAFGMRFFVRPPEHEQRVIGTVTDVVQRTTRYLLPHVPGVIPSPFDCKACGARNIPAETKTDICAFCGSPPSNRKPTTSSPPRPSLPEY